MSLKRSSRLLGSAVITAGLAFSGLSVTAPAAQAATTTASAEATYTCTTPLGLLPITVPAQFTLTDLPEVLLDNLPVPAGIPLVGQLDFSAAGLAGLVQNLLLSLNQTVDLVLGELPIVSGLTGTLDGLLTPITDTVVSVVGSLPEFIPGEGTLPIPIPLEINFAPLTGLLGGIGVNCTLNPASIKPVGPQVVVVTNTVTNTNTETVVVEKSLSKVKASPKREIKRGTKYVVVAKVRASGQKLSGKVVLSGKSIKNQAKMLKNGNVRFVVKNLGLGRHNFTLKFLGNDGATPSVKTLTVRVVPRG